MLLRQPDPEVQPQRAGHLLAEERAQRAPAHPPDHLANEKPEGQPVVPVTGAGPPERFLGRQRLGHEAPVVEGSRRQRLAQGRQACLVIERVADQHPVLAVLFERWPVGAHRGVHVKVPTGGEHVGAERGRTFGARPDIPDRVLLPRPAAGRIGRAAPQVDQSLTLHHHTDRRANLAPFGEAALELLAYLRKTRFACALDRHGHLTWSVSWIAPRGRGSREC